MSDITPYFIAKHLDLLDTVFFVLRKKDNQVTFLHVFHHTLTLTWAWFYQLYYPTDHFVVVGLINSFVHVLMYAYYGISTLGPEYAKYVWWKKHLTKVQLVSFSKILVELYSLLQRSRSPDRSNDRDWCTSPFYNLNYLPDKIGIQWTTPAF